MSDFVLAPMDEGAFPANVVNVLKDVYATSTVVNVAVGRPLRTDDPHRSVGIFSKDWVPDDYVIGQEEANSAIYQVNVQSLVRHANEEEGRLEAALFAKYVRAMVARDAGLRARLAALSESSMGVTERFQRVEIRTQRFIDNELSGTFLFLASMEVLVTVESVTV